MSIGTVSGITRRAPRSLTVSHASSRVHTPPIPDETTAPSRSPSTSGAPASAQASRVAMIAYCALGSILRVSVRARTSAAGTASWPAKSTGISYCCAQSFSRVRTPDFPASAADQVEGTSPPSGVVAPSPVTTTVLRDMCAPRAVGPAAGGPVHPPGRQGSGLGAGDEGDGVLDGGQAGHVLVGDAHLELLLGQRDDRHHRQRVDVEVVGEGLVRLDRLGRQTGLLVDDLRQSGQDLLLAECHGGFSNSGGCSGQWSGTVWSMSGVAGDAGQGRVTTWAA